MNEQRDKKNESITNVNVVKNNQLMIKEQMELSQN